MTELKPLTTFKYTTDILQKLVEKKHWSAEDAMKFLNEIPTADVEEVRHGEWEYEQLDEYKFYKVTCPYCDAYYMGNYDAYNEPDDFNYCPNCGAKMDGERNKK